VAFNDRLGARRHTGGRDEETMRERELRQSIIDEFLSVLDDPRVARTRKHSLETILVLSLLAVICGADSFVGIERFGAAKAAWLSTFLDLSGGIPSHDTVGRVFAALDPRALGEAFQRWTLAITGRSKEKLIAIDGKTLRRSFRKAGDHAFVHMVSAWSANNGVVLGQVKTEDKSNEITAIPMLLDLIDVKGATVTIDAAGTQTAIAEKIVEKGGDYMLAVKGNQPTLHEAIIEHFADDRGQFGVWETHEQGHGREEIRRAWVSHCVEEIATHERWSALGALVRIQSTRTVGGKTSTEDRYFISSRKVLSAIDALHTVRRHWSIENELHWVLDVAFREDDCRVRAENAAANFSAVRQHALALLKQRTETKVGIKNRRLCAAWDDSFLLRVIGFGTA
jgi:predicted transposase YbfD/YdcC